MEKPLVGAILLVVCMLVVAGPYSGLAHKYSSSKKPRNFSFFLHNTMFDPAVNNTKDFNSVYGQPAPLNPASPTFLGTMATFEDPLTVSRANNSEQIGVAQGFLIFDSKVEYTLLYVFTANISKGEHRGTLSIMGQERRYAPVSYLTVLGGSGAFEGAHGLATSTLLDLQCDPPPFVGPRPSRWTHSFDLRLYY